MAKDSKPKHSNYLDRLVRIDAILENRANPKTYDQIITALEKENLSISERQLRDTFKLLEEQFGLEIQRKTNDTLNNKKTVFYYKDAQASLFAKNYQSTELELILNLVSQLSDYEGLNSEEAHEILKKFNIDLDSKSNKKIIDYEKNESYQAREFFSFFNTFYSAIKDKEVLVIEYKPYDYPGSIFVFHPYYLKQYNSRWFCLGHREDTPDKRTIDLVPIDDRIESIQIYKEKYPKENKKFNKSHDLKNWQRDFFNHFIGVTKGKRVYAENQDPVELYTEEVTVRLLISEKDSRTLHYLDSKPIHHSQKIKPQPNGDSILELTLIPNYELERFILSYSDVMTVLEPKILRDEIAKRLRKSMEQYALPK